MTGFLGIAEGPWRALVHAFTADLAQRVEAELAGKTTLATLDLTPARHHAQPKCRHAAEAPKEADPPAAPSLCRSCAATAGLGAAPDRPAASAAVAAVCRGCSHPPASACVANGGGAEGEAAAAPADLSPVGVLSPVSPPSSRRTSSTSVSVSASVSADVDPAPAGSAGSCSADADMELGSIDSSASDTGSGSGSGGGSASASNTEAGPPAGASEDRPDRRPHLPSAAAPPSGSRPAAAAEAGAATCAAQAAGAASGVSGGGVSQGEGRPLIHVQAQAQARMLLGPAPAPAAACQPPGPPPQPLPPPRADTSSPTSAPAPAASADANATAASATAAAASTTTAAASAPAGPAWGCPRRPVTLRLRCLVRDPLTSSLLATARGHVDDPGLPVRGPAQWPHAHGRGRGQGHRQRGGQAGGGVGVGVGEGLAEAQAQAQAQAPGSLLLLEEAVLGRGAFGFVTLVSDATTGRTYALKRLRRASVSAKHVMQEQQALRLLMRDVAQPHEQLHEAPGPPPQPPALPALLQQPQQQRRQAGGEPVCSICGAALSPPPGAAQVPSASAVSAAAAAAGAQQPACPAECQRCSGAGGARGKGEPSAGTQAQQPQQQQQQQRPCGCRVCVAAAATGGRGAGAATCLRAGAAGAGGGVAMGPARAAWLAKRQALGLLPTPAPPAPQALAHSAPPAADCQAQQRQRQQQHARRSRARLGPATFCVRQLGTFQDEHYLYMLLEYCPGGDLDRLVRRTARKTLVPRRSWIAQAVAGPAVAWRGLPEQAARFYAAGVVLALQELHVRSIVYRDLKPGNVLLDGDGYPRLADFGLAKLLPGGPQGRATSACGTLDYMAPEVVKIECEALAREGGPSARQLANWVSSAAAAAGQRRRRGEPPLRRREGGGGAGTGATGSYGLGVDWWSFGVLLYVLLTGTKPFSAPEAEAAGEDPARLLVRIINPWFEVPLPLYLSPPARDLLKRLLVRQPRWRLGCGGGGAEEIKAHPFFEGFDWDAYCDRKLPPPYPPTEMLLPEDQEAESVADFFGYRFSPSALTATESQPLNAPIPPPPPPQRDRAPPDAADAVGAAAAPAGPAAAGPAAAQQQQLPHAPQGQAGAGRAPAQHAPNARAPQPQPQPQPQQPQPAGAHAQGQRQGAGQGAAVQPGADAAGAGAGAVAGEEPERQAAARRRAAQLQQREQLLREF